MNNDRIEGNWKEMKGKVQQKWGKLTDDDLDVIDGRREELVGKIQQEYGKSRDEAEKEVDAYFSGEHAGPALLQLRGLVMIWDSTNNPRRAH